MTLNFRSYLKIRLLVALSILIAVVTSNTAFGANELGVRVSVIAESDSKNSQLYTDNSKLWFISPKNQVLTRTIWIQDTVGNDQVISLSIGGAKNVSGKIEYDAANKSEISDWVTFSENNFQIGRAHV